MKRRIRVIGAGVMTVGLLTGTLMAEGVKQDKEQCEKQGMCAPALREGKGDEKQSERAGERAARREQQDKQMMAFRDSQRDDRLKMMEAVKSEEDAHKALAILREGLVTQRAKAQVFFEAQREKRMTEMKQRFEAQNVPVEKRDALLKKMDAEHESGKADSDARYAAKLALIDALAAKADLTQADIREALNKERPQGKEGERLGRGDKHRREGKRNGANKTPQDAPVAPPAL